MATKYRTSCVDCGWQGRPAKTEALAQRAYAAHSCDKERRRRDTQARGDARRAAVDRTPKPCLHKYANHQHGTYACYVQDACKCPPCSAANRAYEQTRTRQQAYGRWNGLIDAEPARQHIRSLMDQGMGLKRIVAVSDLSQGQLWKLLYGKKRPDGSQTPSRRIRPETADRILAVKLDLADGARVDATGSIRRVRALVALGWSQSKIANRLGMRPGNFGKVIHGYHQQINVAHSKAVRALYDEWSMRLPPAETHRDKIAAARARNYARAYGWLPPLAWDDEVLDDPAAAPLTAPVEDHIDEAAVARRMQGDKTIQLTKREKAEVIRQMLAAGWSQKQIEIHTGLNVGRYREAS